MYILNICVFLTQLVAGQKSWVYSKCKHSIRGRRICTWNGVPQRRQQKKVIIKFKINYSQIEESDSKVENSYCKVKTEILKSRKVILKSKKIIFYVDHRTSRMSESLKIKHMKNNIILLLVELSWHQQTFVTTTYPLAKNGRRRKIPTKISSLSDIITSVNIALGDVNILFKHDM